MKKIIFILALTVFIAGIILTSCNSSSKRIENDEERVLNAKVRQDSIIELQQFKRESQNQIRANERTIAKLKLNIEGMNQRNRALYEENLAELEERNKALKIKLVEYNEGETNQWQAFKSEFKRDMDELGKACSDFTDSNKTEITR